MLVSDISCRYAVSRLRKEQVTGRWCMNSRFLGRTAIVGNFHMGPTSAQETLCWVPTSGWFSQLYASEATKSHLDPMREIFQFYGLVDVTSNFWNCYSRMCIFPLWSYPGGWGRSKPISRFLCTPFALLTKEWGLILQRKFEDSDYSTPRWWFWNSEHLGVKANSVKRNKNALNNFFKNKKKPDSNSK